MHPKWYRKTTHISWHISLLATGILLGIAASISNAFDFSDIGLLLLGLILFCACLVKRRTSLLIVALIAGCLIGLWRGDTQRQVLSGHEVFYGKAVSLTGSVAEDVSLTDKGEQRIRLTSPVINDTPLKGTIWISTTASSDIKRGDQIKVSGIFTTGFGTFSGAIYRAQIVEIERPYPGDVGRRIRDGFNEQVRKTLPDPEASLASGYLTGQKAALPETLSEQLRTVGLTHVVVASGYNLTILVQFARRLLADKSKYLAVLVSSVLIVWFILITGFSPSMSRAGLVAGLGLLAWYYGRTVHPLVLIPLSAAITGLMEPSYLWGDIGWYLSFTAFTGVLLLAPLLKSFIWGDRKVGLLKSLTVETMSAQVLTMPLIIYTFSQYSPYALLANLLVLPLVPLAMLLTFIVGITNIVLPFIGPLLTLPCLWLLKYMVWVVSLIAEAPGARMDITSSLEILIIGYVSILFIIAFLWQRTGYNFKKSLDT